MTENFGGMGHTFAQLVKLNEKAIPILLLQYPLNIRIVCLQIVRKITDRTDVNRIS